MAEPRNDPSAHPRHGSPAPADPSAEPRTDPSAEPRTKTSAESRTDLPKDLAANPILSRWIRVQPDGVIDVQVGKVELGQGIVTALAQIAADELGVGMDAVRMVPAGPGGPDEGMTAGSMSIMDSGSALRVAAANVRALFEAAAGTADFSYAEWADRVDLNVCALADVPLRSEAVLVGQDVARLDLPDKIFGRPRYIQDMRLPGQLFGRVVRPPSRGARLLSVTGDLADGVSVVRDGSFLGLVGADEARVVRCAESFRRGSRWAEHDSLPDEKELDKFLRAGPHETIEVIDDAAETHGGDRLVRATYSRPFVAHASMAPSCGVAVWRGPAEVDVWSHSQGVFPLGRAIAAALGLDPAGVRVEHAESAGCYGHNAADDAAFDAVLLARAVPGTPVQVLWSRQDELSWAPFGSAMTADVAATLSADGRLTSWHYDVYSQGHTARPGYAGGVPGLLAATFLKEPADYPAAVDPSAASGYGGTRNALPGYDLPRRRITGHRLTESPIRSSAMRALGAYLNVFAIECFMDEAAEHAGRDPLEFRLAHLSDPRGRRVLTAAAEAAGWGSPQPEGVGLGLGYARYKGRGGYCAVVAEVEAESEVRLRRLTIAVDVGRVVNPDGVRNQIEGGALQSASWTLVERVRFDRRQVTSDTWETYPILRFSQVPRVDVTVLDGGGEKSVGAGEAAQGPTAAAIGNGLAAAIGVRVRDLPLTSEAVITAIERDN
ncbi:xanthine dehydrogenase family protein molybdopterin-binding subunit [Actinoplanes sp. TBRC 11911]|uniref:xanthine dehydrogenase family protein molybdopterin-binding subunit n=1 Tax=Actinoplanes sp. TBRC 11911 TaxID=2729386 RepID=UPI00145D1713|nr:molybdopterin cofactor-binding domain-containing protein [Actinoplanes sp. TBRC 11911]NMO49640.1 xanthine dehydrogenase family protein molybdopterin-binding subunit [Actinoplanes sp. TBRC 11911]